MNFVKFLNYQVTTSASTTRKFQLLIWDTIGTKHLILRMTEDASTIRKFKLYHLGALSVFNHNHFTNDRRRFYHSQIKIVPLEPELGTRFSKYTIFIGNDFVSLI